MTRFHGRGTLLALDPSLRETGWAIFGPGEAVTTGVLKISQRTRIGPQGCIDRLLERLDRLAGQRSPSQVALSLPSGIRWRIPSLELLESALSDWTKGQEIPLFAYTAQEVRLAIAGNPNAPPEQLGYSVMLALGLIGQAKTTHEWEALAVGHYHISRRVPVNPLAGTGGV